jgi:hypothetical protein
LLDNARTFSRQNACDYRLKDLLDQQLITQSDFDVQKQAILASIVTTGGEKPRMRGGVGAGSR